MKFVPRHNEIIGRTVIKRKFETIIRPDQTKNISKFVLADAVGPGAAEKGIKVGDILVPKAMGQIVLDGSFRPVVEEDKIAFFATNVNLEELLIQVDNGTEFVPFGSETAALSLGAPPGSEREPEAAAAE